MAIPTNVYESESSDEEPSSTFSDESITQERQMDVIRVNTNGLYTAICGTIRFQPSLETKLIEKIDEQTEDLKRKIEEQSEKITRMKRKLNAMDKKLNELIMR